MIDLNKYEEITENEYNKLPVEETAYFRNENCNWTYFKLKEVPKFPKVFEDVYYKIKVEDDMINIKKTEDFSGYSFCEKQSLPLLEEAIKYRADNK